MNLKNRVPLIVLLALSSAGIGYWMGQHQSRPASETAPSKSTVAKKEVETASSAPTPAKTQNEKPNLQEKPYSLQQTESKLLQFSQSGNISRLFNDEMDWMKMLADVKESDIPQLLAFVDSKISRQMRWALRNQLLQRLAQSNLSVAINYANALPNRQEREQCLAIVVGV